MSRLRLALVIVGAIALGVVLLEWTITTVDPLRISRFSDFRLLASVTAERERRPVLVDAVENRVGDGIGGIGADGSGERIGLSLDGQPGKGEVVVVGSSLAFGYGVRAGQSFVVQACRPLGVSLRVHSHPFVTRFEFGSMLEQASFAAGDPSGPRVLVLVDRLRGGLSKRLRNIRGGLEQRGFVGGLVPAISQVLSLASGSVDEERGDEELGPVVPALAALRDRAAAVGAVPVFVDTGAEPQAESLCEQFAVRRVSLVEGGVRLHPLTGFPDGPAHAALADVLQPELEAILATPESR